MPFSNEVDTTIGIVYVRGWGALDLEEGLRAQAELSLDPDYQPDFGVVVDLRELLDEPRAKDLVELTRNLLRLREHFRHRVALVVSKRLSLGAELSAAMASAGGVPIRVFSALDEAYAWVRPDRQTR